jgi:2,3-bisphosphoglycerate-dependent phosphoglycerate mutase
VTLLLVRHAEPVPARDPRFEENDRPLSDEGRRQADRLAEQLAGRGVEAIYSSPYPRSIQTVEPLAERLRLESVIVEELRERLLSPGPLPGWLEQLERSWAEFEFRLPGGESSAAAQERAWQVLHPLADRHRDGVAVVASHGNLIALALHRLVPAVGFDFWRAMPLPAVYAVGADGRASGPGLDPACGPVGP